MNYYEVEKNPVINGGKKRITKEKCTTEYECETGVITRNIEMSDGVVGREPDYIKIYTDCLLLFNNISPGLSPYIIGFSKFMTFANYPEEGFRSTVSTCEMNRKAVANFVGVSESRVKQAIHDLIVAEIFIPIVVNGKTKRGIYFVNPWVVGKGEWKDIKQLRAQFEFITGAESVLSIDNKGNAKAILPLTFRKPNLLEDNNGGGTDEDVTGTN